MASWLKIYPNAKLTAPDVVVAVRAKLLNCHTKIKKLSKIDGGASTPGSQQEGSSTPSTPSSSVNILFTARVPLRQANAVPALVMNTMMSVFNLRLWCNFLLIFVFSPFYASSKNNHFHFLNVEYVFCNIVTSEHIDR